MRLPSQPYLPLETDANLLHRLQQVTDGQLVHKLAQPITVYQCGIELWNEEIHEVTQASPEMDEQLRRIKETEKVLRQFDRDIQMAKLRRLFPSANYHVATGPSLD